MAPKYDVVIFGATGFTGERVALYAIQQAVKEEGAGSGLKLLLAGRTDASLKKMLDKVLGSLGLDGSELTCDLMGGVQCTDEKSLMKMCSSAKVCINCVGPFRYYGEPVVKACIANKTHYVDVCGEPEFMTRILAGYDAKARAAGSVIVVACGFDSVPADLGVFTLDAHMKRISPEGAPCAQVDGYLTLKGDPKLGMVAHFATYASGVAGFGSIASLMKIRMEVRKDPTITAKNIPRIGRPPRLNSKPTFAEEVKKYTLPFPGADAAVVRMSQNKLVLMGTEGTLPHFTAYVTFESRYGVLLCVLYGYIFGKFAKNAWGRWLLLTYPAFFTNNCFTHEGPTPEQMAATSFTYALVGKYEDPALKPVKMEVHGPEPAYVATPILVVECAYTLLKPEEVGGGEGGVFTPSAAFGETDLVSRLTSAGVRFEVSYSL